MGRETGGVGEKGEDARREGGQMEVGGGRKGGEQGGVKEGMGGGSRSGGEGDWNGLAVVMRKLN